MPAQQVIDFPVVGGSNIQRSQAFDSELSINCYPYFDTGSSSSAQYRYAGFEKILDFNVSGFTGRPGGSLSTENESFHVIGNEVYKVDFPAFTTTLVGTIATTVGEVSMSITSKFLTIVDGTSKFEYDIVLGTFTAIPGTFNPNYTAQQQGFTFYNNVGTQTIIQSAPNQPSVVDPASSIQIDYNDAFLSYPLLAMKSINGSLLCFNSGFIETLEDEGSAGFAFRPDVNLTYEYGAINAESIAKGTGGNQGQKQEAFVIFLSKNPDGALKFMMASGGDPVIISTSSIDYRVNQLTKPEEAVGFLWTENGQTFYQVSWTTDNLTLVYYMNQGVWFDVNFNNGRHPAESFCSVGTEKLFTSAFDGGLYRITEKLNTYNTTTDAAQAQVMPITRVTKNMRVTGYKKATVNLLTMYFEQGSATEGTELPDSPFYKQGSDPAIKVGVSADGGVTFPKTFEAKLGKIGEREFFTRIDNLGTQRDWCFRFEFQSPTNFAFMGMQMYYAANEGTV